MSFVYDTLEDPISRYEADLNLWSNRYSIDYIKSLCKTILDPTICLSSKKDAANSFRKLFASRWIESLNFHGELEDELKDIFKNEFYAILLSDTSEEIKTKMKNIIFDVYKEKWIDVWLLSELNQKVDLDDKIYLELLINATTFFGHEDHDRIKYKECYKNLATIFVSLVKKYFNSLPKYCIELKLLLKCSTSFVFEGIIKYMNEDVSYFVEKLQDFVVNHPTDLDIVSDEQSKNVLAAKEQVFNFWSKMHYDNTNFIKISSNNLYNSTFEFIKNIPPTKDYDDVFCSAMHLSETLFTFFWEEMKLSDDDFNELFKCLVIKCQETFDMDEANFVMKEPLEYAHYVLSRDAFSLSKYKSKKTRHNSLYNYITCLVKLRDCIAQPVLKSIENQMNKRFPDSLLDKDFYWNFMNSLNQDGDDDSYDNRSTTNNLLFKMADILKEGLTILNENVHPLLKCDVLKFMILQRKQFGLDDLNTILDVLIDLLTSPHPSVTYFSAFALQRIIWCKDEDYKPIIKNEILLEKIPKLFENVMENYKRNENKGNEFVINALKEAISNLNVKLINSLVFNDLLIFIKNQIIGLTEMEIFDENFALNLFECVGHLALICIHKGGQDTFERIFIPAFKEIVSKKHKNYISHLAYITICTLLLHKTILPSDLHEIIPRVLASDLWLLDEGFVSSAKYSFAMFFRKHSIGQMYIDQVINICDKLLMSYTKAFHSIHIFVSIAESCDESTMKKYLPLIYEKIVKASQLNKEVPFLKGVILFTCYTVSKFGAERIVKLLNKLDVGFLKKFIIEIAFPLSKYTEFIFDKNFTTVGLSLLVEYLALLANHDPEMMTIWAYSIITLADVMKGFELRKLIGDHRTDDFYRMCTPPLMYDYDSDLKPDETCCQYRDIEPEINDRLKKTLEKYPDLTKSRTFLDLNFDLKLRKKLKVVLKRADLPIFPHLTYPGDDDDDEIDPDEFEMAGSDSWNSENDEKDVKHEDDIGCD